jgi:hypothetical protein
MYHGGIKSTDNVENLLINAVLDTGYGGAMFSTFLTK